LIKHSRHIKPHKTLKKVDNTTTTYQCPFCAKRFPDFDEVDSHIATAHPSALPEALQIIRETFAQMDLCERIGLPYAALNAAQHRAQLNDAEYMLVPFDRPLDAAELALLATYPEAWADGDMESIVVRVA